MSAAETAARGLRGVGLRGVCAGCWGRRSRRLQSGCLVSVGEPVRIFPALPVGREPSAPPRAPASVPSFAGVVQVEGFCCLPGGREIPVRVLSLSYFGNHWFIPAIAGFSVLNLSINTLYLNTSFEKTKKTPPHPNPKTFPFNLAIMKASFWLAFF